MRDGRTVRGRSRWSFARTLLACLAGRFDVELARCEDAASGQALGWPPKPIVLHGSFDRLPVAHSHY